MIAPHTTAWLGNIPGPALYEVLGTHQRSKNREIRGQFGRNLHVLEILKKGVFFKEKGVIFLT